jgi:hypothetical protein
MSVAQAEAVLVAASCPPSGVDEMLSGALLHAVKFGPVGLASANSTIPQMLEPLVERLAVADGVSLQRWHVLVAVCGCPSLLCQGMHPPLPAGL